MQLSLDHFMFIPGFFESACQRMPHIEFSYGLRNISFVRQNIITRSHVIAFEFYSHLSDIIE